MLSWVFRHSERLAAIYGRVEPPALAGERFLHRRPALPAFGPGPVPHPRPGDVRRRGRFVELRPMPKRVDAQP